MVLGAKGSPLQMILSAVYHIDAPTGNIKLAQAQAWMKHPFVESAIPLAYGDSYKGYSVLGTTHDYINKYQAVLQQGKLNENDFEVVVGSTAAGILQLKVNDRFYGNHGDQNGETHNAHAYVVTGILKPSGSVIDNLIVSNVASVWKMHDEGDNEDEQESNQGQEDESKQQEITAVLLKFRNPMGQVQFPYLINTNTYGKQQPA